MWTLRDSGRAAPTRPETGWQPVLHAEQEPPETAVPQIVTVILSRYDQGPSIDETAADVRVLGRVKYGCGGVSGVLEFDWMNGGQLTLAADRIDVEVSYEGASAGNRTPAQIVTAAVAVGTRPAGSRRTRSFVLALGAGASARVQVPPHAAQVQVLSTTAAGYPSYAVALDTAPAGGTQARWTPASATDVLPLPANIRSLNVTNNRAGADTLTILFLLDV